MNQNENKVLELINVKKTISTKEICKALYISESTARRIMARLSKKGAIVRFHGGGHNLEQAAEEFNITGRLELNTRAKDGIAKAAAEMVTPGAVIIMMGGTTVYKMCKYLQEMSITVITNSLIVFDALKNRGKIDIVLLGGHYNRSEMEVWGVLTNANLKMLRADMLFMGTSHFHPSVGFLTNDLESLEIYRNCMDAANTSYVLADSSKLGERGTAVTATCKSIDGLITDDKLGNEYVRQFEAAGVSVVCATPERGRLAQGIAET